MSTEVRTFSDHPTFGELFSFYFLEPWAKRVEAAIQQVSVSGTHGTLSNKPQELDNAAL
jgi:hypothetical protein